MNRHDKHHSVLVCALPIIAALLLAAGLVVMVKESRKPLPAVNVQDLRGAAKYQAAHPKEIER